MLVCTESQPGPQSMVSSAQEGKSGPVDQRKAHPDICNGLISMRIIENVLSFTYLIAFTKTNLRIWSKNVKVETVLAGAEEWRGTLSTCWFVLSHNQVPSPWCLRLRRGKADRWISIRHTLTYVTVWFQCASLKTYYHSHIRSIQLKCRANEVEHYSPSPLPTPPRDFVSANIC